MLGSVLSVRIRIMQNLGPNMAWTPLSLCWYASDLRGCSGSTTIRCPRSIARLQVCFKLGCCEMWIGWVAWRVVVHALFQFNSVFNSLGVPAGMLALSFSVICGCLLQCKFRGDLIAQAKSLWGAIGSMHVATRGFGTIGLDTQHEKLPSMHAVKFVRGSELYRDLVKWCLECLRLTIVLKKQLFWNSLLSIIFHSLIQSTLCEKAKRLQTWKL